MCVAPCGGLIKKSYTGIRPFRNMFYIQVLLLCAANIVCGDVFSSFIHEILIERFPHHICKALCISSDNVLRFLFSNRVHPVIFIALYRGTTNVHLKILFVANITYTAQIVRQITFFNCALASEFIDLTAWASCRFESCCAISSATAPSVRSSHFHGKRPQSPATGCATTGCGSSLWLDIGSCIDRGCRIGTPDFFIIYQSTLLKMLTRFPVLQSCFVISPVGRALPLIIRCLIPAP